MSGGILHLGCGTRPLAGAVNHDKRPAAGVDVAHDLDVLPWPWADGAFSKVIALDVMEHLRADVAEWLDECWRILADGGTLALRLPAWDHENSHIDPTHRRLFHPLSFGYWDRRTDYWRDYGSVYFQESGRWWRVESVERLDAGANLGYVLVKEAQG
jgi:SAM-dependent methyltransferase